MKRTKKKCKCSHAFHFNSDAHAMKSEMSNLSETLILFFHSMNVYNNRVCFLLSQLVQNGVNSSILH